MARSLGGGKEQHRHQNRKRDDPGDQRCEDTDRQNRQQPNERQVSYGLEDRNGLNGSLIADGVVTFETPADHVGKR